MIYGKTLQGLDDKQIYEYFGQIFFFKFIDQFFNNMQYEIPVYNSLAMKLQFLRSEFSLVI